MKMSHQMENINKEREIIKWDQKQILELKRNTKESPSGWNERTLDNNSNPHEEIKSRGFPGGAVAVRNPPASIAGTQIQSLIREDPTCLGATKPVLHNNWACALEPVSHNYWAHGPQLLKPACLESMLCNKRSHCNEKPEHCNEE